MLFMNREKSTRPPYQRHYTITFQILPLKKPLEFRKRKSRALNANTNAFSFLTVGPLTLPSPPAYRQACTGERDRVRGGHPLRVAFFIKALNPTILLGEMQLNKELILFDDGRRIS
jgi:hypothetical protein